MQTSGYKFIEPAYGVKYATKATEGLFIQILWASKAHTNTDTRTHAHNPAAVPSLPPCSAMEGEEAQLA